MIFWGIHGQKGTSAPHTLGEKSIFCIMLGGLYRVGGCSRVVLHATQAFIAIFAFAAVVTSISIAPASASTPTPSTWNLLAAGERTAIFPADVMQQSNLTLNNGTYFYNL